MSKTSKYQNNNLKVGLPGVLLQQIWHFLIKIWHFTSPIIIIIILSVYKRLEELEHIINKQPPGSLMMNLAFS